MPRFSALRADDVRAGFLAPVAHMPRERLCLARRVRARDHDPVEDRGEPAHVDGDDVVRLDVLEGGEDELLLGERGEVLHRVVSDAFASWWSFARAYRPWERMNSTTGSGGRKRI